VIDGPNVKKVLGLRIKFFRAQRQLSQADLAEKADISITFLSNIERGIKYPAPDILSQLANSLDVDVYELFRPDDSGEERKAFVERFSQDITKNVVGALESVYNAYKN
jgi:transcriptional regulator with XRE-family HTH domain